MIDVAVTFLIVVMLMTIAAFVASRHSRNEQVWIALAFGEYLVCAAAQFVHVRVEGGDANYYRNVGGQLAELLDESFFSTSKELFALLVHQPSIFDDVVVGAGTNTGSMCAGAAWIMFFARNSPYAAQALLGGLALFSALATYSACRDAYREASPFRLFAATVFFPSVAFWTSSFTKEAFCMMGLALVMTGWRAARSLRARALLYFPLGVVLIVAFRAPVLPPVLLGLVIYLVLNRIQAARGTEAAIVAPLYVAMGLAVLALGMVLVTRLSPELALDRLSESVASHQGYWRKAAGGSSFDADEAEAVTLGQQLLAAPLGLLNALFRPQIFDVTNPLVLVGAVEMSAITWMMFRSVRIHGVRGIVAKVQASPFLAMCAVVTIVGCTFVGLTTRNFGSLARYRVPFLPFYGVLLMTLSEARARTAERPAPAPVGKRQPLRPRRRDLVIRTGTPAPAITDKTS